MNPLQIDSAWELERMAKDHFKQYAMSLAMSLGFFCIDMVLVVQC
jgi:hypothetical protein